MLRIAIDATLITHRPKGASRYVTNLLAHLARTDKANAYDVLVDRRVALPAIPRPANFTYRPANVRSNFHWNLFALPRILASGHFDLVHLPSETRTLATPCPSVVTVHEIAQRKWQFERHVGPYQYLSHVFNERLFRHNIRLVQRIIAVSDATKDDLASLYGVEAQKIAVIHEAADPSLVEGATKHRPDQVRARLGAPAGFVLSFATGDTRENVAAVLAAFGEVHGRVAQKLVLCGAGLATERQVLGLCRRLGILDRVSVLPFVDDTTLSGLYASADLYVDMSYYEGFGLQAIEAMSCGAPVVASRIPAFMEVLGAAAVLVGVDDVPALAQGMERILRNPAEQRERSRLGRERAGGFSWQRAAEETLAVYRAVAGTR